MIEQCLNAAQMRSLARKRAHPMVFDYIDGGAEDEKTLRRNSDSFANHGLVHRVLRDVSDIDTSVEVLGERWSVPFCLSPAAGNRLFHNAGERAVAKAASDIGAPYALSTLSSVSLEEIAVLGSAPKWFQLYVWKDRELVTQLLERAKAAGYTKLVLTADFPFAGRRERDLQNRFTIPPRIRTKQVFEAIRKPAWTLDFFRGPPIAYANISETTSATSLSEFVNEQMSANFSWQDSAWLIEQWPGDVLLKGVAHPEDAVRAARTGFAGIILSNHGGRQLDSGAAPLDILPMVRKAVGGDYPIILDGGIRRGTDMMIALALGATAVGFARPYLYGLAAGGHRGVAHMLDLFRAELELSMALAGVRNISELNSHCVVRLDGAL